MMKKNPTKTIYIETAMHLLVWLFIFLSPLLFAGRNGNINWNKYLHGCIPPFFGCFVFYMNYLVLVPRLFFKGRKQNFFLYEALLLVFSITAMNYVMQYNPFVSHTPLPHPHKWGSLPRWVFIIRDGVMQAILAGIGIATRLSREWYEAEAARKEAELKNLRNQLNPHFLLNTLNNIYALTAFDANKAQETILELSNLLRYVLYDNQQTYVDLHKEADFLQTYIELMRIRIPRHVKIEVDIQIPPRNKVRIAPLLFISLVENAFKHGISPNKPSHIGIHLHADAEGTVTCHIENSNYPKSRQDKSGNGIGLQQVQQRLTLLYSGKYTWEKGCNPEQTVYTSCLTIHTQNS